MNLLVISRGRNIVTKRRNLHIPFRPLLFHAILNETKSGLLAGESAVVSVLWAALSL